MITKPTAFILGAGVSMPYGFPSGGDLVRQICGATAGIKFEYDQNGLLDKGDIIKILQNRFGGAHSEEFGKALHLSQRYSIDAFLERRPEYTEIGKYAISLLIIRKEIEVNLFDFNNQDKGCYRYLFDKMDTNWDRFPENEISFITFNYDRSLEHFLFTSLQKTFGKSEQECADVISKIPIIHIHGSLGKLPWQNEDNIAYGGEIQKYIDKHNIGDAVASKASKQIKVIPENQLESSETIQAADLLSSAERIYFLGFSYHDTNMRRLDIGKIASAEREIRRGDSRLSRMKGTGFGLEQKELETVQKWFINVPDSKIDSLTFLRRYADLD